MSSNHAKNIPLYVGLAIPVLMIVLVAASIYVPALLAQPEYGFVYAMGSYPTYVRTTEEGTFQYQYTIEDGRLTETVVTLPERRGAYFNPQNTPRFFVYDAAGDSSREVMLTEAQELVLDVSVESPDGFRAESARSGSGVWLFGDGGRGGERYFLRKGAASHEIDVRAGSSDYYGRGFHFIGWVMADANE